MRRYWAPNHADRRLRSTVVSPQTSQPADGVSASPATGVVARGVSWIVIERVVSLGTWYPSLLVLAVLLPPGAFGIIAVASAVVAVITILMQSGIGDSLVVAERLSSSYLRRSMLRLGMAGAFFTGLGIAFADLILDTFARGADPAVLRIMVLSVLLAALSVVPTALLKKTMNFRTLALISIVATVASSVGAVVAAVLGAGVWALVLRLVLGQLVGTALVWVAARDLWPKSRDGDARPPRRTGATWFLALSVAQFCAQTFDNLIVGYFTDVAQLGLYALAFSLAYAPLTQVSWWIGGVLFPAIAATSDPELVRRRTLRALRLMSLLLLPLVPVAIVMAPALIPPILGPEWEGMVTPFQILVGVGVGQGVLNVMGETLAGSGRIALRARIDGTWALATMIMIAVAADAHGIRGAALAHFVTFSGLAAAYVWWGGRSIGLTAVVAGRALGGVATSVLVQGAITAVTTVTLDALGAGAIPAAFAGAVAGLAALAAMLRLGASSTVDDAREVLEAMRLRRHPSGLPEMDAAPG